MFYMARALLENAGIRLRTDKSVHAITFDVLIYFFYLTGKLQKHMLEDFAAATEESAELLGKQKAGELVEAYFYEKKKRAMFTYEMGAIVMQEKARTSIERATRFNLEIRKILAKQ